MTLRTICGAAAGFIGASVIGACTTPGTGPHDMSVEQHDEAAESHAAAAETVREDGAVARSGTNDCVPGVDGPACWTSITNPTATHQESAAEHRRLAEAHRAASQALREAEARACVGLRADDRDMSPFLRIEDIARVEPLQESTGGSLPALRTTGAIVTFRAVPGMTEQWLQRVVDCHLARNAALGHDVPAMPDCPLVPKGVTAFVSATQDAFSVAIRAADAATAKEVLARAERLKPRDEHKESSQ